MSTYNLAFVLANGRINRTVNSNVEPARQWVAANETMVETSFEIRDPDAYWYDGTTIRTRVPLPQTFDKTDITADGVDVARLAGLPLPCTVYVDGTPYEVTDGVFEFTADDPGRYRVSVDEVQYAYTEWYINAD